MMRILQVSLDHELESTTVIHVNVKPVLNISRSNNGSLPGRRRLRSCSDCSTSIAHPAPCRASSHVDLTNSKSAAPTTSTAAPAASTAPTRPDHWLRMSMRRVRPFRLESPVRPLSAPVTQPERPRASQPGRPHSGPPRPTRGQRRRISSSTSRRREANASEPTSPDHSWTRHPLSDDEEDSAPSTTVTAPTSPQHAPVQSNLSVNEVSADGMAGRSQRIDVPGNGAQPIVASSVFVRRKLSFECGLLEYKKLLNETLRFHLGKTNNAGKVLFTFPVTNCFNSVLIVGNSSRITKEFVSNRYGGKVRHSIGAWQPAWQPRTRQHTVAARPTASVERCTTGVLL
ncbi:hypothetical protein J6590_076662 [Homalodisca vitripennis]|nr:hypothetical protein J6590_076662 [Homalodisca vitripennis]